jgi:hypothetical protein
MDNAIILGLADFYSRGNHDENGISIPAFK